jgi:hypothetical protein
MAPQYIERLRCLGVKRNISGASYRGGNPTPSNNMSWASASFFLFFGRVGRQKLHGNPKTYWQ